MKRNQGFTLIELLAALVILGVIMMVAMPNVVGILNQNRNITYVEDAKKLSTTAEYKFRGDNTLQKPTSNGQCIGASLKYLDNSEFDNPPYGGEYVSDKSFIIMKKSGNAYEYYVQLIEAMPNNKGHHGVKLVKVDELYEKDYAKYIANFDISKIPSLTSDASKTALQAYVASTTGCTSMIRVYAVDAS